MSVRERQREMGGGKEREEKREARRGSKCKVYPLTDLLKIFLVHNSRGRSLPNINI